MAKADELRAELTARARNSESCKGYLVNWVMDRFREGENPVYIYCRDNTSTSLGLLPRWEPQWYAYIVGADLAAEIVKNCKYIFGTLKYENGKHFAKLEYHDSESHFQKTDWVDVTASPIAQRYTVDGKDISDKMMFLRSEGFQVQKYFKYGSGDVIEVTF